MSLLRLVALVGFDRLPASVQPEGLDQASRYALDTLPIELRQVLAFQALSPPSGGAAIRFHHLLRRLTQLHLARDLDRAANTLELLFGTTLSQFNGIPLPDDCQPAGPGLLLAQPPQPPYAKRPIL
ncbi:MAG: hypothetical protein MZW92_15710 [Comamonadaceae bacterium]|nr:hypothetical protein [Comamonadaceae bacterium]